MPRDPLQGLSPCEALLGDAFDALHPNVRMAHEAPLAAEGVFDVVHGTHPFTRILVAAMKLPAAGSRVPVTLSVVSGPARQGRSLTMHWSRRIGRSALSTRQYARDGVLVEESGCGSVIFSLRGAGGCLMYEHASMHFLRLPVPALLSPRVRASVAPDSQGWRVEVIVDWRAHLICRYWGTMRPVRAPS